MTVKAMAPVIKVSDIDKSETFYCAVLGFKNDGKFALTADGPFYLSLTDGRNFIHLSTFPGDSAYGIALYFDVDNVDTLYSRLQESDLGEIAMGPTNQTWGRREFYIKDPDGNRLAFGSKL